MPDSRAPERDNDAVSASVQIRRSVGDVFAFYRDFANLPQFLGDVMAVAPLGPKLSRWTIEGPFGLRAWWIVELTEARPNELIRYRTVGPPGLKTHWEVWFSPGLDGGTELREVMTVPLGPVGRGLLGLIGKPPAAEVSANLHRLKQLLETGSVTDMEHAVAGKFRSG